MEENEQVRGTRIEKLYWNLKEIEFSFFFFIDAEFTFINHVLLTSFPGIHNLLMIMVTYLKGDVVSLTGSASACHGG